MADWIFDRFGWIISGVLAILVLLIIGAAWAEESARQDFMAECLEHRLQYECTAMWRQGIVRLR